VARASARVAEIINTHEVEPLPEDVLRQLDEIREAARRGLLGVHATTPTPATVGATARVATATRR
jgi:hypothetical protein